LTQLIAILGRGIQRSSPGSLWDTTEDIEICDDRGAHLIVRQPVDDTNQNCLIGGGKLNVEAGFEYYKNYGYHGLDFVVCAYGDRARYIKEIPGSPSESEVMSEQLEAMCKTQKVPLPKIETWGRDRSVDGPSNTLKEVQNIFELAVQRQCLDVIIITVLVHLPRVMLFAQTHSSDPRFKILTVKFMSSEETLCSLNPKEYGPRILNLFSSSAFQRTARMELRGVEAFLNGTYGVNIKQQNGE